MCNAEMIRKLTLAWRSCGMLTLTPQLLVSTAIGLATCGPRPLVDDVRDYRGRADTKRGDASLRFVHFVGFWSHYTPGRACSSWPLPLSTEFADLARFADQHGGLAPNPRDGDVFLLASVRASQPALAGIVVAVETVTKMLNGGSAFICITAEGEVRRSGNSPRVANVHFVRRRLSPVFGDCFIRWCDLPARMSLAGSGADTEVRYEVPNDLLSLKRTPRRRAA
jgi:hypothetical protein